MNKIIKGAQGKRVDQVIYNSKGNLISCSCDGFIKIWELKNGEYKNIVTFNHTENVKSFLLFENRNILFSFGYGMLKSWNLTNNKFKSSNNNFNKFGIEKLAKIDEKRFMLYNYSYINIMGGLGVIKTIKVNLCSSIKSIDNKGIIIIGGYSNIYVIRSDNYELIQTIYNAHEYNVNNLVVINDTILHSSSTNDYSVQIWSLEK